MTTAFGGVDIRTAPLVLKSDYASYHQHSRGIGRASARGVAVEVYVEGVLARETQHSTPKDLRAIGEALDRIKELSKGNILGDLNLKDLINEGRKY